MKEKYLRPELTGIEKWQKKRNYRYERMIEHKVKYDCQKYFKDSLIGHT